MYSKITYLSLYAIAMGYLEAVVVIYLRRVYFGDSFQLPLVTPADVLSSVEFVRETATLVMIFSVAMLAGGNAWSRFAAFMFVFGLWDIVYYVGLWATIGWPQSLGTWDILFLIPIPWVAPVWAPAFIALLLMVSALALWRLESLGRAPRIGWAAWSILVGSGLLVISSFLLDSSAAVLGRPPGGFAWLPYIIGVSGALLVGTRSYVVSRAGDR